MYERFTHRARKVMQFANLEAQELDHEYIGTEHMLLGLERSGGGVAAAVFRRLGVDGNSIRRAVKALIELGPEMLTKGKLPETPRAKRVINYAIDEALAMNHDHVGTEHILIGLLRVDDGVAAAALDNVGVTLGDVRRIVLEFGTSVRDDG